MSTAEARKALKAEIARLNRQIAQIDRTIRDFYYELDLLREDPHAAKKEQGWIQSRIRRLQGQRQPLSEELRRAKQLYKSYDPGSGQY